MEPVELARQWYQAASTCPADVETLLSLLDVDVVWTEAAGSPWSGDYAGREEVAGRLLPGVYEIVEGASYLLDRLIADGPSVTAFGWLGGTRVGTTTELRVRFAHHLEIRGDAIVSVEQLLDTALLSR